MGTTPLAGLPYPEPSAAPFVHLDIKSLAESVDSRIPVVAADRAGVAHRDGRLLFETSTDSLLVSDGTSWHSYTGAEVFGSGASSVSGNTTVSALLFSVSAGTRPYARKAHAVCSVTGRNVSGVWQAAVSDLQSSVANAQRKARFPSIAGSYGSATPAADFTIPAGQEGIFRGWVEVASAGTLEVSNDTTLTYLTVSTVRA